MTRLSSNLTRFWKVFFPIGWLAFAIVLLDGSRRILPAAGWIPALTTFFIVAASGWVVYRRFAVGVAGEVWDDGNRFIVKQRGERSIPLHQIAAVSTAEPNRVILELANGDAIAFLADQPSDRLVPELAERVRIARAAHALFGPVAEACEPFRRVYETHQQKFRRLNARVLISELFEIYATQQCAADGKSILAILETHRNSEQPEIREWVGAFFEMLVSERLKEIG